MLIGEQFKQQIRETNQSIKAKQNKKNIIKMSLKNLMTFIWLTDDLD